MDQKKEVSREDNDLDASTLVSPFITCYPTKYRLMTTHGEGISQKILSYVQFVQRMSKSEPQEFTFCFL